MRMNEINEHGDEMIRNGEIEGGTYALCVSNVFDVLFLNIFRK